MSVSEFAPASVAWLVGRGRVVGITSPRGRILVVEPPPLPPRRPAVTPARLVSAPTASPQAVVDEPARTAARAQFALSPPEVR